MLEPLLGDGYGKGVRLKQNMAEKLKPTEKGFVLHNVEPFLASLSLDLFFTKSARVIKGLGKNRAMR